MPHPLRRRWKNGALNKTGSVYQRSRLIIDAKLSSLTTEGQAKHIEGSLSTAPPFMLQLTQSRARRLIECEITTAFSLASMVGMHSTVEAANIWRLLAQAIVRQDTSWGEADSMSAI